MLQKLTIRNYAIIEELEISFSDKLNIITGETGAGKSIIMGALGLILGERADSGVLVNREFKCVVEGVFVNQGKISVRSFLTQNELDVNDELIIRREISPNGKSRAFVNDTPVTLSQLAILSGLLVDLHQQFDTHQIGEHDFQRDIIDALATNASLLKIYEQSFRQWQVAKKDLNQLSDRKLLFEKEFDYNQFQYNELEEAGLEANELETIDSQLRLLNNAEEIKSSLSKVFYSLSDGDSPIVAQLKILCNLLHNYTAMHPGIPLLLERLQSTQIELQDIADETDRINDQVQFDQSEIDRISDRLSLGYKLLKKHGVKRTNDLLAIQAQLREKLEAVLNIDEQIRQKQENVSKFLLEAKGVASKISTSRKKQIKPFEDKVNKLLQQIGMPNARLKVLISELSEELGTHGCDVISFLFNANHTSVDGPKTGQFQPVGKIASGGELSRLMLSIKSLVAQSVDLPTMIFDEIDTGISGEAARQVGAILKTLATARQIICITHQPQIAGKADRHFFVYKDIERNQVKTNIRELSTEERITAVAKMLSGEKPTAAAMENAREMVMN